MPELLTKYPDVAIDVLESEGARCGPGYEQEILKKCPPEQFCKLAGGELCIYGLDQAKQMTQISPKELSDAVGSHTSAAAATPVNTGCNVATIGPAPAASTPVLALLVTLVLRPRRPRWAG